MRRSADFSTTVRQGVRTGRPRLVVHLLPSPGVSSEDPATAGFVVSKAVGGAVTRNRVKRRLRHLLADRIDTVPAGTRLVVRALAPAAGSSGDALAADLDSALARALDRATRGGRRAPSRATS